jgi:lysozyme
MALRDRIKAHEGLRLKAYQDTKGVWTIGYGHTGPEVKEGLVWTLQQAEDQLTADIKLATFCVSARFDWSERLTQDRRDALVELCFNMGIGRMGPPPRGLLSFTHMLAAMQAGNFEAAAEELLASKWEKDVGPTRANAVADLIRGREGN